MVHRLIAMGGDMLVATDNEDFQAIAGKLCGGDGLCGSRRIG